MGKYSVAMEAFAGVVGFSLLVRFARWKMREKKRPKLLQRMGIISGVCPSRELSKDGVVSTVRCAHCICPSTRSFVIGVGGVVGFGFYDGLYFGDSVSKM